MKWADKRPQALKVRTNADTPRDAAQAVTFGAEGIGLCRTEHMFFEGEPHQGHARDDRRQDGRGPQGGPCQDPAVSAGRLRGHVPRAGGPSDDHPLPGSRRCTSSCPPKEEDIAEIADELDITVAELQGRHRLPARVQPDDGPPRLPSGRHLSGDRRDADHRRHQRRHQRQQGAS